MPPESTPRTGPSLVATTGAPCFAPAAEAASAIAASARLRTRPDELSLRMTRHSDCVSLGEMQLRKWMTARQSLAEVAREMGGGGLGAALGPLSILTSHRPGERSVSSFGQPQVANNEEL
jgi:hypothetical protein